jgi:outer membrane protein assembly factor BamB
MKRVLLLLNLLACVIALATVSRATDQNWPQWRGPNRDGKVSGFEAPKAWPKELTQKWKVPVGDGVASPALVDNKLYVFSREDNQEIIRCLDAATGNEIWHDKYDSPRFGGNDAGYQGPRASPTVGDGKVITVGVLGIVNCYNAADGKKLWTKEIGAPPFHAASSPIIVDGLCIAQIGGGRNGGPGGITAYDLNTGEEKWKWAGDGAAYASPVLVTIGNTKVIVAVTASKLVAVNAADGKGMWDIICRQLRYQSASPVVDGQTVIYAGPMQGLTATTLELKGDVLAANERWRQPESSLMYNTPVVCGGALYGISGSNNLFCVNAANGDLAWTTPIANPGAMAPIATLPAGGDQPGGPPGRGRGRGMVNPANGYGSVVDAGSVLMALNPEGQLVVFEPDCKEFKLVANYKVAEGGAYAYPIVAGNRVFVKDKDSVAMWTIE